MQVPTTLTAGRFLVAALFFVSAVSERVASHAWAQVNPPSKQPSRAEGSGTTHVLPLPDFRFHGSVGRTIAESDPPEFPQPVRPPKGAPNIVFILIDDAGYGQFGTFGGQVPTPALDRVAADGLRYTRFHTTALCSPTRAALLTGRNHHSTGNGVITEAATGYDGYTGIIGKNVGTIAEVLRQYGYATAWFGKNHNTPDWETSQVGPFDRWPSGLGFDYFYGFMGGDMDQWQPTLVRKSRAGAALDESQVHSDHGPGRPRDRLAAAHAVDRRRQAVLPVHVDRRHARSAPRLAGVHREVQRASSTWAGTRIASRRSRGRRSWASCRPNAELIQAAGRAAGLGFALGRPEAAVRADDGSLRRLHRADRLRNGTAARRRPLAARCRQHADLLRSRRQRRLGRRRPGRPAQRELVLQQRARVAGGQSQAHRRDRRTQALQSFSGRLGLGHEHAVPMDQADRLAPGRRAQSARRVLAGAHQGPRRRPRPVSSRDRHRAHDLRSGGHSVSRKS